MKRILLALLLSILFLTPQLSAQGHHGHQDMEDVIYLKNGSIYRGDIIEQVPGVSYKIEILGGSIVYLKSSEVDKIVREPRQYDRHRGYRVKPRKYVNIETTASAILYFNQVPNRYAQADISGGGGIAFLPEFRRENRAFSFLIGASVQLISVRNWAYDSYMNYQVSGTIYRGFQTRYQMPLWFRWTFATPIPIFFQFGWSIGGNAYTGRGDQYSYSGGYGSGHSTITNGHIKFVTGSVNISPFGIGIRKEIWKQIELIGYLEGAACNLEFDGSNVYKPYVQLHVGFNFGTQGKQKVKTP